MCCLVWPTTFKRFKYTERKLQKALETLLMADRKFKSGVSDIMDAIETAIIQICLLSR